VKTGRVSSDPFINDALTFFGDPDPTQGSPWDKGRRLAGLIRNYKTLLILDGLEPARLCGAEGKKEEAQEHLKAAKALIGETGYGRRLPELRALEEPGG
jgi:hypothetical protein